MGVRGFMGFGGFVWYQTSLTTHPTHLPTPHQTAYEDFSYLAPAPLHHFVSEDIPCNYLTRLMPPAPASLKRLQEHVLDTLMSACCLLLTGKRLGLRLGLGLGSCRRAASSSLVRG